MEVNALGCGEFPTPGHIGGVLKTDGKYAEVFILSPSKKVSGPSDFQRVLYFYEYQLMLV